MLSEDIFIKLVEAIEAEGGELLPEVHMGVPIIYEIHGRHGRVQRKEKNTVACGAETVVLIPYAMEAPKSTDGKTAEGDVGFVKACIVCDRVDLWERFSEAVSE